MIPDPRKLIDEFRQVAKIAGVDLSADAVDSERLPVGHTPSALPKGKMGVYVFAFGDQCLKVGKSGPKSRARYKYQHYSTGTSQSNLAKSLIACSDFRILRLSKDDVGKWIKDNVDRTNFLLEASCGIFTLNLLEAFLQCKLKPKFEGFGSQR